MSIREFFPEWSQKTTVIVVLVGMVISGAVVGAGYLWVDDRPEALEDKRAVVVAGEESIPERVVLNQTVTEDDGVVRDRSVVQYTNVSSGEYAVTERQSEYSKADGSSEFVEVTEWYGTVGSTAYERSYIVDSSGTPVSDVPQYSEDKEWVSDDVGVFIDRGWVWSALFEGVLAGVPGERVGGVSYQGESAVRYEFGRDGLYWGETPVSSVDGWMVTDSSTNQLYAANVTIEIASGNKAERVLGLGGTTTVSYAFSSTVDVEELEKETMSGE